MKELAAIYYALTMQYALLGQKDLSAVYGKRCVEILREHGDNTLKDCALARREIFGIPLPEIIHRELVVTILSTFDGVDMAPIRRHPEQGVAAGSGDPSRRITERS